MRFAAVLLLFIPYSLMADAPLAEKKHLEFGLKHQEAAGIGYNTGYSTLNALFGEKISEHFTFFIDGRGHVFNTGRMAASGGIGVRIQPKISAFGFNLYYDFRSLKGLHGNQIGTGFEILDPAIDFRINGYFPLGSIEGPVALKEVSVLNGPSIWKQERIHLLQGGDVEIGKRLICKDAVALYGALGAYYFTRGSLTTRWGSKARLAVTISSILSLQGEVSHDHLFKTRVTGQLALNFSFGAGKKEIQNSCRLNPDLFEVPHRQEIVVAKKSS